VITPERLNGHPLDILLEILGDGSRSRVSLIDVTKIQAYRDGVFAGQQFTFTIDSPPAAKEFIEQEIMKPLGGYLWVNSLGKISVNFFYPIDTVTEVDWLTRNSLLDTPSATQADLINTISFRFDDSDGKFLAESVQTYAPSVALYGQYGQTVIESKGMRSGLQGFFLAGLTARLIFSRYGKRNLKFDDNVETIWSKSLLEPGDIVAITHPQIPDRAAGVDGNH
jgi:hypothetical protein